MATEEQFNQAQEDVKTLTKRPDNMELLNLYAYFKQASTGDVQGKKPGMLDLKGRAKYEAWEHQKGMAKEDAMGKYVDLVSELLEKYK